MDVDHALLFSHILYLDFVRAHKGGIRDVKKNVNLDQIMQMRQEENIPYFDFIEFFVSSVIGKSCYKQNSCDKLLSEYVTISDEAFAILIFENNFDAWVDMGIRKDTSGTQVPRKYTNGGKSKADVGSSQHNKGWSEEGLKRFNELFDKVKKNRSSPEAKDFEEKFRAYCDNKVGSKKKKVKVLIQDSFVVRHELGSNNKYEKDDEANDAKGPQTKKTKICNSSAIITTVTSMYNKSSIALSNSNNAQENNNESELDMDLDENCGEDTEDEGDQPDSDGYVPV